ncbi:MAG: hypothetical protein ACI85U_003701, partial [Candidatus Promineifilaceae bacterium]
MGDVLFRRNLRGFFLGPKKVKDKMKCYCLCGILDDNILHPKKPFQEADDRSKHDPNTQKSNSRLIV